MFSGIMLVGGVKDLDNWSNKGLTDYENQNGRTIGSFGVDL
jgi:hypothetical protein